MSNTYMLAAGFAALTALSTPAFSAVVAIPEVPLGAPIESSFGVNDYVNDAFYLTDLINQEFTYTALGATAVSGLKIEITGLFDDVELFAVEFTNDFGAPFETATLTVTGTPGNTGSTQYFFSDFSIGAGDSFTLLTTTSAPLINEVTYAVNFVSQVPVPAALPLMLTALGGMVALRRKKA